MFLFSYSICVSLSHLLSNCLSACVFLLPSTPFHSDLKSLWRLLLERERERGKYPSCSNGIVGNFTSVLIVICMISIMLKELYLHPSCMQLTDEMNDTENSKKSYLVYKKPTWTKIGGNLCGCCTLTFGLSETI